MGDCSLYLLWNEVQKYLSLPLRESPEGDGKTWLKKKQASTGEERAGKKEQLTGGRKSSRKTWGVVGRNTGGKHSWPKKQH